MSTAPKKDNEVTIGLDTDEAIEVAVQDDTPEGVS